MTGTTHERDTGPADPHGESSADAGTFDLTPRTAGSGPTSGRRRRGRWPLLVVAVVVVAIGVLLLKTLGDASLFFKNADAAVAERPTLGEKRFRMQGTVLDETVTDTELDGRRAVQFSVAFNGVEVDVVHVGDPPQLFKPGVPVVLEGRWTEGGAPGGASFVNGRNDGWYFASDRMLVKHDSTYTAKNEDRLKQADEGGKAPVTSDAPPTTATGAR